MLVLQLKRNPAAIFPQEIYNFSASDDHHSVAAPLGVGFTKFYRGGFRMPGADENQPNQGTGAEGGKNDQGGEGNQGQGGKEGQGEPKEMTPEEMKAEIQKLRKENADRRTKGKSLEEKLKGNDELVGKLKQALGIETEEEKPEVVAAQLRQENAAKDLELGISRVALAHGIPGENFDYFDFLFRKHLANLEEGEEMGEEAFASIVDQVKGIAGSKKPGASGIGKKGNEPPPGGDAGEVDLSKFAKMTPAEKGQLYTTNPALYERLFQEAKQKRMI
jgi:hypothetical protein